jgi:dihydrofolate reductase
VSEHQHFNEMESRFDTHLFGRRMWELMSAYWPTAANGPAATPVEVGYAVKWNRAEHFVFSRTLSSVEYGATLASGTPADVVAELKSKPGKDISVGGADLAQSLFADDLIDEVNLYVVPTIVGGGKRMFAQLKRTLNFRLTGVERFESGVALIQYAGE